MSKPAQPRVLNPHGFARLAMDATVGLADVVEAMHYTVARTPRVLGKPPEGRAREFTGFI